MHFLFEKGRISPYISLLCEFISCWYTGIPGLITGVLPQGFGFIIEDYSNEVHQLQVSECQGVRHLGVYGTPPPEFWEDHGCKGMSLIWMPLHATRIADQRLLNMVGGKCRSALSRASVASCALTKNVATVGLRPLSCSPGRPLPTSHPEMVKKCEAQQVSRQLLSNMAITPPTRERENL